jgi:hypothetical protein
VRSALCDGLPPRLVGELDRALAELRGFVPDSWRETDA